MEWCEVVISFTVDIGPTVDKELDHLQMVVPGRVVQGRDLALIQHVHFLLRSWAVGPKDNLEAFQVAFSGKLKE